MKSKVLVTALALALGGLSFSAANAATKAFPFYANQLGKGEYFHAPKHKPGEQGKGFDITMLQQHSDGKWRFRKQGTDGSKNSHSVIYGKKFYAISGGTVFRCWRNAPENAKPGVRHPQKLRMPGGGNQIWVRDKFGNETLYAHATPGSIPASICPISKSLYSKDGASHEADLPKSKQVKIKKGQYLGRVGNSGSSSGPHLHVHVRNKSKQAVAITWDGGLSNSKTQSGSGYTINLKAKWYGLTNKKILANKPVIWPRIKRSGTWRWLVRVDHFQRFFDHGIHSGFMPYQMKGVIKNGSLYYDSLWKPANKKWKAWYGLSQTDRNAKVSATTNQGYKKVYEWRIRYNGSWRYSLIFYK